MQRESPEQPDGDPLGAASSSDPDEDRDPLAVTSSADPDAYRQLRQAMTHHLHRAGDLIHMDSPDEATDALSVAIAIGAELQISSFRA